MTAGRLFRRLGRSGRIALVLLIPATALAQGFFPRGDSDCSAVVTAADLIAQARAIGGSSICGNDDCDRDGQITAADRSCAAGCLFGDCPPIAFAPAVVSVDAMSAPAIVPLSVVLLKGTNFGAAGRLKQVTIGGIPAPIGEPAPGSQQLSSARGTSTLVAGSVTR